MGFPSLTSSWIAQCSPVSYLHDWVQQWCNGLGFHAFHWEKCWAYPGMSVFDSLWSNRVKEKKKPKQLGLYSFLTSCSQLFLQAKIVASSQYTWKRMPAWRSRWISSFSYSEWNKEQGRKEIDKLQLVIHEAPTVTISHPVLIAIKFWLSRCSFQQSMQRCILRLRRILFYAWGSSIL